MDTSELTYRLRVALSYREAVEDRLSEAYDSRAPGDTWRGADGEDRKTVLRHQSLAEASLERIRSLGRAHFSELERQLDRVLRALADLPAEISRGTWTAAAANDENRRLCEIKEALSDEIRQVHSVLRATRSDQLGGVLHQTLAQYERNSSEFLGGATRRSSWRLRIAPGWVWLLIAIAVAACLPLFFFGGSLVSEGIEFSATMHDGVVIVRCDNLGTRPILLDVPRRDPVVSEGEEELDRYAIDVYVLDRESDVPQQFPDSDSAWSYRGLPMRGRGALVLNPGIPLTVRLNIDRLREAAGDIVGLRLVCRDEDDVVMGKFDTIF